MASPYRWSTVTCPPRSTVRQEIHTIAEWERGHHGIHVTGTSGRRLRHLAYPAAGNAPANRHPALGRKGLRHAVRGVSALPDQDRHLHRRARRDHLADPRAGWVGPHRRLVDSTDRVPEG